MTDEELQKCMERYRHAKPEHLQAALAGADAEKRRIINAILDEKQRIADAPAKQRSEKEYEQRERHHRQLMRAGWFAALVSIIGAAATWFGVWVQWQHTSPSPAPASQPSAATPSPTEAPAEQR